MTSTRVKVSAASPSDGNGSTQHTSDAAVISPIATIMPDLGDVFALVSWAEDEIERAIRRHPDQSDVLHHAFDLLRPRDIGAGMSTEFVYRSHVHELLERIATGADARLPTDAEMCVVCAHISLTVPLHGPAAGLYFRLWLRAFPDRPITPTQAADQVHYERLHRAQINEYEAKLRRKATDPNRLPADIDCAGRHHGTNVTCRYAATTASRRAPTA